MKIDHDSHVHTYLSACCKEKETHRPAAILSRAETMGVKTIGFADHLWVNPDLTPSDWYRPQDESQIARLRADLSLISTNVRVLVGCETEMIAPGKFGITPEFAESLDFVLLPCSHFHMTTFVAQPEGNTPRDLADHMLAFFRSGVTSGLPTSIAHPFVPLGRLDQLDDAVGTISDAEFLDAFGLAAEQGVALEVTVSYLPAEPGSPFSMETPVRFLSLARQAGCKFTFGTDAHSAEVQTRLPELVRITDAVGITEADICPTFRARAHN